MTADTASRKDALTRKIAKVATYYHPRTWKVKGFWWTIGLNGAGYGLMGNHSLVSASYVSRVNAAITDLRHLLQDG